MPFGSPFAPRSASAFEPPPSPSVSSRLVGVRCDDLWAGEHWARALCSEGLRAQVQVADDRAPTAADAVVLHVSGQLAEQLGSLRALRARAPQTPLLLAVRELRDLDQVLGLEMGADDAVDTRLPPSVIAARLRALWRRGSRQMDSEPVHEMRFGRLELQRMQRRVALNEQVVPLTEGEFELLWLLASHAGQTLSRTELLRCIRGLDYHPMDRSIDNRIYRIRAKFGDDPGVAQRLRSVRNHGYVFCPEGW